jgi:hypothetical protein
MPSYTVNSLKQFMLNNRLDFFHLHILIMFASYISLFMVLNKPLTHGFCNSHLFCLSLGFRDPNLTPPCLCLHRGSLSAHLLLYVDGIILTANSTKLLNHIITNLHSEFAMRSPATLSWHFGAASCQWYGPIPTPVCF